MKVDVEKDKQTTDATFSEKDKETLEQLKKIDKSLVF